MKLTDVENNFYLNSGIKNTNFGVDCTHGDGPDSYPDIEFGKTYYTRFRVDGVISTYSIRFYGISFYERKFQFIGERCDGVKIKLELDYFFINRNQFVIVTDCNGDTQRVSAVIYKDKKRTERVNYIRIRHLLPKLLNYIYPNKFQFHLNENNEFIYYFRFYWTGIEVNGISFKIKPFDLLFEQPKCTSMGKYKTLGVMYDGWGNDMKDEIDKFVDKTYFTIEECKRKNKEKIYCFDDEENDEEENKNELIHIAFVGLINKEQAKQILKELKENKIK